MKKDRNEKELSFDEAKEMFRDNDESDVPKSMTETGDAIREINRDEYDKETNQTSMDMKSVLNAQQVQGLAVIDTLVAKGILGESAKAYSRQMKRLSPSVSGRGRDDIVSISTGIRDKNSNSDRGLWSTFSGLFGGKGSDERR